MQTTVQRHGLPLPTSSIFLGVWWAQVRSRRLAPNSYLNGERCPDGLRSLQWGIWRKWGTTPWLLPVTSIRIQSVSSSRPL